MSSHDDNDTATDVQSLTCGAVTITGPRTMTLGEMWDAIKASPALRVCLDGELRAARESARGATPADLETARRDMRAAVLEDAFRAGVDEGERCARAAGIVDGLGQQPRDVAGRIREMVTKYAIRWADEDKSEPDAIDLYTVLNGLRAALHLVRTGRDVSLVLDVLRSHAAGGVNVFSEASNELEAAVRET